MNLRIVLALCGAAVWLGRAAEKPADALAELFPNPVIVKGRGFEIRQRELDDRVTAYKATLASQGVTVPPREEPRIRKRLLDRMILTAILLQRATPEDRKIARKNADKFIQEAKKRSPSEASYRRQLISLGMTPEEFEKRAFEQAVVEQVINREIKSKLSVSDAEIRRFYTNGVDLQTEQLEKELAKANPVQDPLKAQQLREQIDRIKKANLARLQKPAWVRAQMLVFYTADRLTQRPFPETERQRKLKLAKEVLEQLRAGKDFKEIALKYSEDPDVTKTGGEYTAAETTSMSPELKQALFTLPLSVWSDVIVTPIGYYLARVVERHPAEKAPIEDAAPQIKELLLTQKVTRQLPDYLAQLKKEYAVKILLRQEEGQ
ncbi:MAG: peptidylprolyl isomerase [Verrucomicrobia bacterium]|nr:peptidylprolyl isomerase [Verrucomicrobiota bacterium]